DLAGVGDQEVHERGVLELAAFVVGHLLVQGAGDPLGHAAVDLAFDDSWVDEAAAVVDDAVTQDPYLGGVGVGLDDGGVDAAGEGGADRGKVVTALDAGLVTAARDANVPTAYPNRRVSPVTTSTSASGTPSSSAAIWANTVWWPCPWLVSPVATLTFPVVSMTTCAPS